MYWRGVVALTLSEREGGVGLANEFLDVDVLTREQPANCVDIQRAQLLGIGVGVEELRSPAARGGFASLARAWR